MPETSLWKKRATIFVNASSGWDAKQEAPQLLQRLFEDAGVHTDIRYVEKGVNLAQLSREAVVAGNDIVIAGGGDGTLSATASGVVGSETVFGILPVGTLNHFARDLKVPLDMEAAAKIVLAGHTDEVDVGEVNGKTFLNNSILGLYPIYRFLREKEERRGWGRRMSFLLGVFAILRKYPSLKVRLFVNGQEIERKTPYILIANNRHAMEGWHLGARESLDEGKLWIYVMRQQGRWGLMRMLLSFVSGRFRGEGNFDIFSAEDVWVEPKGKRIGVALDGEVTVMDAPLHYRVLPRSLKVLVPPPEASPVNMRPALVEEPASERPALSPQPA